MAFLIILSFGGGFVLYVLVLLCLVIGLLVNLGVEFILVRLWNSCITEYLEIYHFCEILKINALA